MYELRPYAARHAARPLPLGTPHDTVKAAATAAVAARPSYTPRHRRAV